MMSDLLSFSIGLAAGCSLLPLLQLVFHWFTLEVEDETSVILTRFGKIYRNIQEPGLYLWGEKMVPWVQAYVVSQKKDQRHYEKISINDCRGTTVMVDLWIEFRIKHPEKALFQVENWERSCQSLLTCSATSILGTFEFTNILRNRNELGRMVREDIQTETERWGLEIESVFISKLSLLPEVSQQLFDAVAAQLEKAKADIEETGRLECQLLEAETHAKVAALEAEAKGQYSLSIARAYSSLAHDPTLLKAYTELYQLSLVRPHRTISFHGFAKEEASAMEAAMSLPYGFDEIEAKPSHTLPSEYAGSFAP